MIGMTFTKFAEATKSRFSTHASDGYLTSVCTIGIELFSPLHEMVQKYRFDENQVVILTERLGLNTKSERHKVKTAEILALCSAWLAFQQSQFTHLSINQIRSLLSSGGVEFALDYAILTSGFNHPWIINRIHLIQNEEHPDPKDFSDPEVAQRIIEIRKSIFSQDPNDPCYQAHKASVDQSIKERDKLKERIDYWINQFDIENGSFKSIDESIIYGCEIDIKSANNKINDLRNQIEDQEAIIGKAKRFISNCKLREKSRKAEINDSEASDKAENKHLRRSVVKKFFMMWVASVIATLEVNDSAGLAKITHFSKMTWWRWATGKTVPPYTQFSNLLNTRFMRGNHQGKYLREISTYPTAMDLDSLMKLA